MISGIMTKAKCSIKIINEVVDNHYKVGAVYGHGDKFMIGDVCYLVERAKV